MDNNKVSSPGTMVAGQLLRKQAKHFWIKVTPPAEVSRPILHGTLICQDDDNDIRREAFEFASANPEVLELGWQVEVLRPSGLPSVCTSQPLTKFLKQELKAATRRGPLKRAIISSDAIRRDGAQA